MARTEAPQQDKDVQTIATSTPRVDGGYQNVTISLPVGATPEARQFAQDIAGSIPGVAGEIAQGQVRGVNRQQQDKTA